jgi:hypothetical protein
MVFYLLNRYLKIVRVENVVDFSEACKLLYGLKYWDFMKDIMKVIEKWLISRCEMSLSERYEGMMIMTANIRLGYYGLWTGDLSGVIGLMFGNWTEILMQRRIEVRHILVNGICGCCQKVHKGGSCDAEASVYLFDLLHNIKDRFDDFGELIEAYWYIFESNRSLLYRGHNYRVASGFNYLSNRLYYCASLAYAACGGDFNGDLIFNRRDFIKAAVIYRREFNRGEHIRISDRKKEMEFVPDSVSSYMRSYYNLKYVPIWAYKIWNIQLRGFKFRKELKELVYLCASDLLYCICTIGSIMREKNIRLYIGADEGMDD